MVNKLTFEQKQSFDYILSLMEPVSPYGREALRLLQPACPGEEERLRREFADIKCIMDSRRRAESLYSRLEGVFGQLKDIRGAVSRIGGVLSDVDLFGIKRYLLELQEISSLFEEININCGVIFNAALPALSLLDPEGNRVCVFAVSERYAPDLVAIRAEKRAVERELRAASSEDERALLTARRGVLADRENAEEDIARAFLSRELLPWKDALLRNTQAIGRLDLLIQKAALAAKHNCCFPEIGGGILRFTEMINPEVDRLLTVSGGVFTPLSLELDAGAAVITGANMGGKSVALRTLTLNVLLIHCGICPFAREAVCPLFDGVFLISGDTEAAERGLSSFGGEIVRLNRALSAAEDGRVFILLDEFAKGTNPTEGAAVARGVCAYLNTKSAYTVMATHFEGVAAFAGRHYQVAGLTNIDMAGAETLTPEERVTLIARYMDYGIRPVDAGCQPPVNAVDMCRLLGLPGKVLETIESCGGGCVG